MKALRAEPLIVTTGLQGGIWKYKRMVKGGSREWESEALGPQLDCLLNVDESLPFPSRVFSPDRSFSKISLSSDFLYIVLISYPWNCGHLKMT